MYNQPERSITKWQIHSHGDLNNHCVNLLKIAPGWHWMFTLYSLLISKFQIVSFHSLHSFTYHCSLWIPASICHPASVHFLRNVLAFYPRWIQIVKPVASVKLSPLDWVECARWHPCSSSLLNGFTKMNFLHLLKLAAESPGIIDRFPCHLKAEYYYEIFHKPKMA